MTIAKPTQVATPFANSGLKNTIPQSATGSNLASLEEGFPAVTMAAVADGGTPPQGQDFNGILNQVTNQLRYAQAGGLYPYDATFCTAIGGYPLGAILMSADGSKLWQNQIAGNTNNPDLDSTNWLELCTVNALTAGLDGKLSLTGGTMTGQIQSSVDESIALSRDTGDAFVATSTRSDTGVGVAFGIGAGGDNRGIFDKALHDWLINRDSSGKLQSGGADVILSTGGTMTEALMFNKSSVFILNKDGKAVLGHDANKNQIYLSSPDGTKYLRVGNAGECTYFGKTIVCGTGSFAIECICDGFVTASSTTIYFTLPILTSESSVTVNSSSLLQIRHVDGGYANTSSSGSAISTMKLQVYPTITSSGVSVRIIRSEKFFNSSDPAATSGTAIPNNTPVGISFNGTLTFS